MQPATPISYSFTELFNVDFSDALFRNGQVDFEVKSKIIFKTFTLSVYNPHLLSEYDYIKSWFPRRLGKKEFSVSATIDVKGDKILSSKSTSAEIARINPELITAIQLKRVSNLNSVPTAQSSQSLFTLDEAFKAVSSGDGLGNIFHQQDVDILNQLLSQSDIRNKKELQYLSAKLHTTEQTLRFTLSPPQFGFLFCVEGVSANHFVCELLDSHATYIWAIERDNQSLASQFQVIDREISTIKAIGRQEYRATNRSGIKVGIACKPIHHKIKDTDADDSFSQWKAALERQLT